MSDERLQLSANPATANSMLLATWAALIMQRVVNSLYYDQVVRRFRETQPNELALVVATCALALHEIHLRPHDSTRICEEIGAAIIEEGCPDFNCKTLVEEVVKEFYAD